MTVTQKQMVGAYKPLTGLKGQRMTSPAKAIAIWNLWKAAESAMDFQIAEEQKLIDSNHARIIGDGRLVFKTPEEEQRYRESWEELAALELEIDAKPVTLGIEDNISISGDDVQVLQGLVNFE